MTWHSKGNAQRVYSNFFCWIIKFYSGGKSLAALHVKSLLVQVTQTISQSTRFERPQINFFSFFAWLRAYGVTCLERAVRKKVLQNDSYAQATIEWTCSRGESLLLLAVALVDLAFLTLPGRISHKKTQPNWWPIRVAAVVPACRMGEALTEAEGMWQRIVSLA